MLFHTPEFFFLLVITFICYYLFRNLRLIILAIADGLFYAAASWGFLVLFLFISFSSYLIARKIPSKHSKFWLVLGLVLNISNLLFFKYSLFILQNLELLVGFPLAPQNSFWHSIILPVGISFYTFQLIAYLVDIYHQKFKPTTSYLRFWVFISFFPHQLAGPIMRGYEFMPQVEKTRQLNLNPRDFKYGVFLIIWGLAKKIMIADQVSPYVNTLFQSPANLSTVDAWVGAYLFGFQIYADFSAYSDMAVGLGYLFGYRLPINFISPYISSNATEFWKRWHVTLSSWIRNFIYFPLGGSRKGKVRKDLNLLAAMLISGLWHGAMWTFVIWGFLHGVLLILHKWYDQLLKKFAAWWPRLSLFFAKFQFLYRGFAILIFFQFITLTWVFFRANNVHNALIYTGKMLHPIPWQVIKQQMVAQSNLLYLVAILYGVHVLEYFVRKYEVSLASWWHRWIPSPIRGLVYASIILLIIAMIKGEKHEFIYFQF